MGKRARRRRLGQNHFTQDRAIAWLHPINSIDLHSTKGDTLPAHFEAKMPEVVIVGSGLAGMSAATRLMEQGFDITLYEQNDFLGGKLGAHREDGKPDPHEHCYHMYLNWYNNFWQFMREIDALEKFIPSPVIGYRRPGDKQTLPGLTNAGSPATILTNMFSGVAPPADQFISAYSLLDLIGTQAMSAEVLEQTSVSNFFRSRGYSTEA